MSELVRGESAELAAARPAALARAEPSGLVVRTTTHPVGDGPFRTTVSSAVEVSIDDPLGRTKTVVWTTAFGALGALGVLGLIGGAWFEGALGLAGIASWWRLARWARRLGHVRLTSEAIERRGDSSIALADVRGVEIVEREDGSLTAWMADVKHEGWAVRVATPRGPVEVARVFTREQADRVAALVEDAYRAFLRRG